jgi:NO-binding membrane sensor protein with MHYT domain
MRISRWLIAIAALRLSVRGIWAMHFIEMAAMSMDAEVSYDVGWPIASVLFAYFSTSLMPQLPQHRKVEKWRTIRATSVLPPIVEPLSAPHLQPILGIS